MKIKKILSWTLIVVLIGIAYGCQKDLPITKKENTPNTQRYSDFSDDEIEQIIVDFLEKLENPTENDPIETAEAIWLLDASLNYTYSYSNKRFTELYKDSAEIVVYFPDDEIEVSELSSLFSEIADILSDHYAVVDSESKHLIDVSLILELAGDGNGVVKVYSFIGVLDEESLIESYGPNDYWYWGFKLGKCGGHSGGTGLDAAILFKRNENYKIGEPQRAICLNKEVVFKYPENYPTNNNPYGNFKLFLSTGSNPAPLMDCLCPDEMSYYQSQLSIIMNDCKPTNKTVFLYDIEADLLTTVNGYRRVHHLFLYYGQYVYVNNSVSAL